MVIGIKTVGCDAFEGGETKIKQHGGFVSLAKVLV